MNWQAFLLAIYIIFGIVVLYGFLFYLYSSPKRRIRIEKKAMIPLSDQPVEPRTIKSNKKHSQTLSESTYV